VPEPAATTPPLIALDVVAVAFARLLRRRGVEVTVEASVLYGEALAAVGIADRDRVYWAGRVTLLRRIEDVAAYDEAFTEFFEGVHTVDLRAPDTPAITIALDSDEASEDAAGDEDTSTRPSLVVRWSPSEIIRQRDFAAYTSEEFDESRRLMADLRLAGALRRSRRQRPTSRRRGRPDLRRTVRRSLRAGGEILERSFTSPGRRPRRVVLICDVSGSMEPYARALLRFLHAAVVGHGHVEAFALGTRLTRLTKELMSRDPDAALAAAARRVVDWSGGTRLGECLRAFNDEWGVRGMARGAIVVILSDGWDRGDPDLLAEQMARLSRVAYRIVWVNPLKASPDYAPLARGMAAALPYVDEFLEGHNLASLEALAEAISR